MSKFWGRIFSLGSRVTARHSKRSEGRTDVFRGGKVSNECNEENDNFA